MRVREWRCEAATRRVGVLRAWARGMAHVDGRETDAGQRGVVGMCVRCAMWGGGPISYFGGPGRAMPHYSLRAARCAGVSVWCVWACRGGCGRNGRVCGGVLWGGWVFVSACVGLCVSRGRLLAACSEGLSSCRLCALWILLLLGCG